MCRKIFLLYIATLFIQQSTLQAQCNMLFKGTVMDSETREVLSGAVITIVETGEKVVTNNKGIFSFPGICPGNYTVTVSHISCPLYTEHFHFKNDITHAFHLSHSINQLEGVTVTGKSNKQATSASTELKQKELASTKGLSLAESLQKITGVSVLQTGTNIYKPVIHGMHSNRVLILNNGIRQEGQQWGSEHAPEVDPFIANRLVVIKGAGSIRYGGDAIGGVILVEPTILRNVPGSHTDINTGFFTNNRQTYLSGVFEKNSEKHPLFSYRLQATAKKGGTARTPNYWLENSGNEELNFSATAGWRKPTKGMELFYSLFNTKLGIFSGSHIGNVTDMLNAINNVQPPDYIINAPFSYKIDRPFQSVQHHLLKINAFKQTGKIGRLNIIGAAQYNWRREYDKKRFASSSNEPQLDLQLTTLSADIVWDHFAYKNFRGTMGVMGSYQLNRYDYRFFIPNYNALNLSVFAIEKYSKNKWLFEGGLRFDSRQITAISNNAANNFKDIQFSNISGNGGIRYTLNNEIAFTANASSAWRAPQVNELYTNGLHHGAARIEKGDANLQRELAKSIVLGTELHFKHWGMEASVYHKNVDGFIFLNPIYPPELTIRGAFPTFQYTQTNARFSGVDISAYTYFSHHLSWAGKMSLVRAWNKIQNDWLIQMPADRYENELKYQFADNNRWKESYIKINWIKVNRQNRIPQTGNIPILKPNGSTVLEADYAPAPNAYQLFAIEGGSHVDILNQKVEWIFTINNLLNTAYRDYMNAFRYYSDEMGRNFSIRLKTPINHTTKKNKN